MKENKKILMITISDFFECKNGMQVNLNTHYQSLVELYGKNNVYVVMLDKNVSYDDYIFKVGHCKNKLSQFIASMFGYLKGCNNIIEKRIVRIIDDVRPNIILCDTSCFGTLIKKINKKHPLINIVSFFHDVDCDLEYNKIKNENVLFIFSYFAAIKQERLTIKYSNKLMCLHNRDLNRIKEKYNVICDSTLPVMIKDKYLYIECSCNFQHEYILFVGAMFGPNVDGIKWYCKEIAPYLKLNTIIVGKGFENLRNELESENIIVQGTVDDLSIYYKNARVVVMPIRYGTGMKVKVAEALMYGKTIVGTTEAFEGYDITDGKEGYCVNSFEEFVDCLNNNHFEIFNENSRKLYLNKYSLDNAVKIFEETLKNLED